MRRLITKTVPEFSKFYQGQISKKITRNKGASQINLNWIWIWKRFGRKTVKIDTKRECNCIRVISLSGDFACSVLFSAQKMNVQGRIQDCFRRECTLLLLYFNTNKPHSFFVQNISCIKKPQVISGGGGDAHPCTLPLDPPLMCSHFKRHFCWASYPIKVF